MSGSSNLNSLGDRRQVAVQLVSCGVLPPGLVQDCTQRVVYIGEKAYITKLGARRYNDLWVVIWVSVVNLFFPYRTF